LIVRYITDSYRSWIVNTDTLPSYDVYISHRWIDNAPDEAAQMLYDALLGCTVGNEQRAISVFYDRVRLKEGLHFQEAFGLALSNSAVFVPILCSSALQRMLTHDPDSVDNVLVEWMMALGCVSDTTHSKMRRIYPLMFGERNEDGSVGDLFAEGVLDNLPEIVPSASIDVVRELLLRNSMSLSSSSYTRTVREVVKSVCKYIGEKGWEASSKMITRKASTKIRTDLEELEPKESKV